MEKRDLYRPCYHFRPEKNWMNDPNGPIWFEGAYHLFYQYNPNGDKWGTIHWGHAVSQDLVHFSECSIALCPETEQGELHCYSGCTFLKKGVPTIYYTSVGEGERGPEEGALQREAYSTDGMKTWIRHPGTVLDRSVHEQSEAALHIAMWRDPFVFSEKNGFYMLLGGTRLSKPAESPEDIKAGHGVIALYFSEDGDSWSFQNILVESEEFWLLECPNMIPFGEEYLLLYSPMESVRYQIGKRNRETGSFEASRTGIFDYSILKNGFYAPNTYMNAPDGRKIVIGWIAEADRSQKVPVKGWAGVMSVPREIWISQGRLQMKPVEEMKQLRKKIIYQSEGSIGTEGNIGTDGNIETGDSIETGGVLTRGRSLEISLLLEPVSQTGFFELHLLKSADGREYTAIRFCTQTGRIEILRDHASMLPGCGTDRIEAYVEPEKPVRLHIFLDYSVLEIYVNETFSMTARIYPSLEDSDGLTVNACSHMHVKECIAWELGERLQEAAAGEGGDMPETAKADSVAQWLSLKTV